MAFAASRRVSNLNPSPRQELLEIQRRIFRHQQDLIRHSTWVRERGFDKYERDYRQRVRTYEAGSSVEELIGECSKARVIYLGDYHTNQQSQRTALRLLKLLVASLDRPLVLVLEMVQSRFQKKLDRFMKGEIEEPIFLKAIGLKKFWYFDLWENFKPLFDFARYHHLAVYGLEDNLLKVPSLVERDLHAAHVIARLLRLHPDAVVFVMVGDLHIAPNHLPRALQALTARRGEMCTVTVYQNSDEIYWRLAEEGLEDKIEVVRIDPQSFCITNTPPVICQQSYLNWLEHDEGAIDWVDARGSFLELVHRIAGFLELDIGGRAEEVEVFTSGDLTFLERLEGDPEITRREIALIRRQMAASESYYFAKKKWVYLATLSLNHAAEEASHFLRHLVAGDEKPRKVVDVFYAHVLHEALGFFGSKIVNHKRKCPHEPQFESLLSFARSSKGGREREFEHEMARLILEHKRLEARGRTLSYQKMMSRRERVLFGVAHALGYMLGDRLYYALVQENIGKDEIRSLFEDPFKGDGEPFGTYMSWVSRLKKVKIPKRV